MKKQLYAVFFLLVTNISLHAQYCDPTTPVFNIDLTGQPNGVWISTPVQRNGQCCSVSAPDKCVQFNLTLDTGARKISFDIYSGAVPGGSMFYEVDCGPPQAVGQPLCLTGPGPYVITFCKPGNNTNQYSITSISDPAIAGTQYVSQACQGYMVATGLVQSSIQWTSVPNNPVYDGYLSCTSGCDSVTISPPFNSAPPYIDYQVCGTIAGGCSALSFCDTLRVNFVNNLDVVINPNNPTICFGGTNATLTANGSGGLPPYNYLWNTGATTTSINVGPGTYFVRVEDQLNCSWQYDTVIVSALASPIDANAGPDGILCQNDQSYPLIGTIVAATGGQWIGQGSFSPSSTNLIASYIPTPAEIANGYADLKLISTGNFNCPADSDSLHITILPNPVLNITGPSQACIYTTEQYSVTAVPGNIYQWVATGGIVTGANQDTVTVQWTTTGINQLSVTETNAAGCDSIGTINVTVLPKPTPQITGTQLVCNLSSEAYSVAIPVTGNNYSWTISNGAFIDSTGSTISVAWQTPGLALVSVTETNSVGCDSTIGIPVNVIIQPVPSITGISNICNLHFATYTANQDTFVYNWSVTGGNIVSQNGNSFDVYWTTPGTGTVTVDEINQGMCDSSITIPVTILQQPTPVINGPSTMCAFVPVDYWATGLQPGDTVGWTISGGIIQGATNDDTIHVLWQNGPPGELTLSVANQLGCDSSTSLFVTLLDGAAPQLTGPLSSCKHDSCTYSVMAVQGHQYQWQVSGGSIVGSENSSIVVYWLVEGAGLVTVTETSPSGCDSMVALGVNVNPLPLPATSGNPMICQNATGLFSTVAVINNNYQWSVTGGVFTGSSTQPSVTCSWPDTGQYLLSLTETNLYGCHAAVDIPIQVLSRPSISITSDLTGCMNRNSLITVNEQPGVTYNYSISGGSIVSNVSGNIQVAWMGTGNNSFAVFAINNTTGCNAQNSMNIYVDPLPHPVIDASNFSGCPPFNVSFINNYDSSSYHYLWDFGEGSLSQDVNPSHTFTEPGYFHVNVFATNNSGCIDSAQAMINVYPKPVSDFNVITQGEVIYSEVEDVVLSNASSGAVAYTWNLGNGDSSTAFEPVVRYNHPGFYDIHLEARNIYGCKSLRVKTIEVKVPEDIYVPNTFTPNGDAVNDFFSIDFKNINSASISIYNRWGEKIYETDDMNFKWGGLYKDIKVLHEVYVYRIKAIGYYGTRFDKMGTLTVVY